MADVAVCSIEGCGKAEKLTRGWCAKHYKRWHTHGDPTKTLYDRGQKDRLCRHADCQRPSRTKGFCAVHYTANRLAPARAARSARHGEIATLKDTDAAYIAGMIDADGMISVVQRRALVMPLVCVANSNFGLIDWLLAVIGAGCAYETKTRATRPDQDPSRWNRVHRYQLTGRKAQALLSACRPYLKVKARQADLVMDLPQRGRDFSLAASDDQKALAAEILTGIRKLNARGREPDHKIAA